jgi:hypothetical protein
MPEARRPTAREGKTHRRRRRRRRRVLTGALLAGVMRRQHRHALRRPHRRLALRVGRQRRQHPVDGPPEPQALRRLRQTARAGRVYQWGGAWACQLGGAWECQLGGAIVDRTWASEATLAARVRMPPW